MEPELLEEELLEDEDVLEELLDDELLEELLEEELLDELLLEELLPDGAEPPHPTRSTLLASVTNTSWCNLPYLDILFSTSDH